MVTALSIVVAMLVIGVIRQSIYSANMAREMNQHKRVLESIVAVQGTQVAVIQNLAATDEIQQRIIRGMAELAKREQSISKGKVN